VLAGYTGATSHAGAGEFWPDAATAKIREDATKMMMLRFTVEGIINGVLPALIT